MNTNKLAAFFAEEQPDFIVYLDFVPGKSSPQRLLAALHDHLEAMEAFDRKLASCLSPGAKVVLTLENAKEGSIFLFIKTALESLDDDALKQGEFKKVVGAYLVKAKAKALDYLNTRQGIGGKHELQQLSSDLRGLAEETKVRQMAGYRSLPPHELAESLAELANPLENLNPGERIGMFSDQGNVLFDKPMPPVPPEAIMAIARERVLGNEVTLILMVRRPDFLGEAQWEFRHQKKKLLAKIADQAWLDRFHAGEISIAPGDALQCRVYEEYTYADDGEVVSEYRVIRRVESVIRHQSFSLVQDE
ncbi:MAG: hypothetical protein LDL30_04545 [Desulfovibrio sp.]|nr:hypothetical protein [Desulfovibrio sp.]